MQVFTWPGKDVDMYEDFDGWTLSQLRERGELVQYFDRLCEEIATAYIEICRNYRIKEKEILVPKTIKVLEPVGWLEVNNYGKTTVVNIAELKKLLNEIGNEISDDYQVWMSSDEEGNEFLPMLENTEFCLAIDKDEKRIIFFPSHR